MENENVVVISEEELKKARRKVRIREAKEKIKDKARAVKNWCSENKQMALAIGITVVSGAGKIVKSAVKQHRKEVILDREQELKDEYVYDRSLGHYWKLRRPLTNDEWLEIDNRKKNGERLSDILDELKVLY